MNKKTCSLMVSLVLVLTLLVTTTAFALAEPVALKVEHCWIHRDRGIMFKFQGENVGSVGGFFRLRNLDNGDIVHIGYLHVGDVFDNKYSTSEGRWVKEYIEDEYGWVFAGSYHETSYDEVKDNPELKCENMAPRRQSIKIKLGKFIHRTNRR